MLPPLAPGYAPSGSGDGAIVVTLLLIGILIAREVVVSIAAPRGADVTSILDAALIPVGILLVLSLASGFLPEPR